MHLHQGARDGEHQRSGVAEIAIEFDRAGAGREAERIQLQVHVAEFFFGIFHGVRKLHLHDGKIRHGEGLDAEIAADRRANIRVLRDGGFDGAGDQLFDLFGVAPGYWVTTEATRTGMSGSLRLGICRSRKCRGRGGDEKIQEIWRFSTKKRAVLCSF